MSDAGISGPDADREALAAEYVMGTLTAREASLVSRAMAADAALVDAVAAWTRHLAPLTGLVPPEAPPRDLWERIERRISPVPAADRTVRPARISWLTRLIGGWAVGATVAAMALGVVAFRQPESERALLVTVLLADRTQLAWTAAFQRDGALRLASIPPAGAAPEPLPPGDRVLQLWALAPGETVPTSLALLPRGQTSITLPAPGVTPVPGMLIEITLEPPGGSPIGRPTGPVLFIGRLSRA